MPLDPFVGEISLWAPQRGMPDGWLPCDGRLLKITDYQVLFAVIGTQYGGDNVTFALPKLTGRVLIGPGVLPGGGTYTQTQTGGLKDVALVPAQMPTHTHGVTMTLTPPYAVSAATAAGSVEGPPENGFPAAGSGSYRGRPYSYYQYQSTPPSATVALGGALASASITVGNAGSSSPHANLQPYLVLQYFIATQGEFPTYS